MRKVLIVGGIGIMAIGFVLLTILTQSTLCVASGPGGPGGDPYGRTLGWSGVPVFAAGAFLFVVGLLIPKRDR